MTDPLNSVLPELAEKGHALLAWAATHNRDVRITETFRTPSYQMHLFLKGRSYDPVHGWLISDPHEVVTHAMPEQAPHCRRAAFDFGIWQSGEYLTCDTHLPAAERAAQILAYSAVGEFMESLGGLTWGGRFSFGDFGHIELVSWKTLPFPPADLPEVSS